MTPTTTILDIYTPDGNVILSTPINEGAKRVWKLGGDDHVILPIVIDRHVSFPIGSYVDIPECGRFIARDNQRPKYDPGTGAYEYELKFEAP